MQITAERLAELHKLQEVYIPQLFERKELPRKEIQNLQPPHVEIKIRKRPGPKPKRHPQLWRTRSIHYRLRNKSVLEPRLPRMPKTSVTQEKKKTDQRRYKTTRLCPCGNPTRVTIYEASLLSPKRIYYGNRCAGCTRFVRKKYK